MKHGFVKVAAAIPEVKVADCTFNAEKMIGIIHQAVNEQVQIVCFPELCITAYTCADLFFQQTLIEEAEIALEEIVRQTSGLDIISIVGLPVRAGNHLFNTAVVIQSGNILGVVPKTHIPNYHEFYEKRWFYSSQDTSEKYVHLLGQDIPFGTQILFGNKQCKFAIEICEDLWAPIPPSSYHSVAGAHIIFNLSASNELIGKNDYRKSLISQQSGRCICGYVYASAGWGESTTDNVFTGSGFISENASIITESERFLFKEQLIVGEIDVERLIADRQQNTSFNTQNIQGDYRTIPVKLSESKNLELTRYINPQPLVPGIDHYDERCKEIFSIQINGLAKRMIHTKAQTVVVGISGGSDSTLALLVCVKAFDKLNISRKHIIGITMPGFGTTNRTFNNALDLMYDLGISIREINISAACEQHFRDIGHDPGVHDITFENTQARERTQILMDIANQMNGLVIGTGDLSELALGWATYNGDHMSMYAVNSGIPKTLVRHLIKWVTETQMEDKIQMILMDILDTPVSPELLPAATNGEISQITEDVVGPYILHDFFLYYTVRFGFRPSKIFFLAQHAFESIYSDEVILRWMHTFFRRFFAQQFKRSCMPDGPKVGSINLSPRGDWRMPSDASSALWLKEIEILNTKTQRHEE